MNINGHEVERRYNGSVYVDGQYSGWMGDLESGSYEHKARIYAAKAKTATLVAEFVRREQAEKAATDAATELDRRAKLAAEAWYGHIDWNVVSESARDAFRIVVRALDADAEQKNKENKE